MKKDAVITPDFFAVSPQLLGLPLASPSRRAFAMAVDGILVAILAQSGGVFLGLAAVFVMLRASRPTERGGYLKQSVRFALRASAAIVMFIVVFQGARRLGNLANNDDEQEETAESSTAVDSAGNLQLNFTSADGLAVAGAVAGLARADEPSEVRNNAEKILSAAARGGATSAQIRDARADLIELMGDDADEENTAALDSVIDRIAGATPDSLAAGISQTLTQEDSLEAEVMSLRSQVGKLESRNTTLKAQLDEAREKRGFRTYLGGLFDDLGLGFGWAAVYFTAFLAMMKGQTPGKKIAGVRVIRLDGKPLGWWIAFERFGGYAASFSVGLLGFVQILWDRNRQGLHDKACETVVVRAAAQTAPAR